jgi:hypothetical protein
MKKPGLDMTIYDSGKYRVDVGYGNIEIVNGAVCNYIWRLRQELHKAGLSENPRHNDPTMKRN